MIIGDSVFIIQGDFEGKTGNIIDIYEGWAYAQYTIELDKDKTVCPVVYHTDVIRNKSVFDNQRL